MLKLLFSILFLFSFNLKSQVENKRIVTLDYLNLTDSLYKSGSYYFKDNVTFFGISNYSTCAVFHTTIRGYHIFSYSECIATYYIENKHLQLNYGEDFNNQKYYIKLSKSQYLKFLTENTKNGKLVSPEELSFNGKKVKKYCKAIAVKKKSFRYKLSDKC
jgi:hypothetical protein